MPDLAIGRMTGSEHLVFFIRERALTPQRFGDWLLDAESDPPSLPPLP
jgi:hypothetical protein